MLLGFAILGACAGAALLGALVAALVLRGKNRALIAVFVVLFAPGLCMLPVACVLSGFSAFTGIDLTSEGPFTAVVTVAAPPAMSAETPIVTETPSEIALSAEEIMSQAAEAMRGVTSAHIIFSQEDVGNYTASGEGVVRTPDRAHIERMSSYDQEPVETIVIGSTGYWVDESVSGGWNSGPIAPFASNPARWVELAQFSSSPILLTEERISGVDCYHMSFAVDLEPGWLGLFSGGGTGEAWISKADLTMVKANYNLRYEGARESATMHLSLVLSDLNDPVTIVAPT